MRDSNPAPAATCACTVWSATLQPMPLRGLQAVGGSDAKLLLAHVGVSDTPSPYKGEEYQGEGGGGEEEEEERRRRGGVVRASE